VKYGQFFLVKTGKPVESCETLAEIEQSAEAVLGKPLEITAKDRPLVRSGDPFKFSLDNPHLGVLRKTNSGT